MPGPVPVAFVALTFRSAFCSGGVPTAERRSLAAVGARRAPLQTGADLKVGATCGGINPPLRRRRCDRAPTRPASIGDRRYSLAAARLNRDKFGRRYGPGATLQCGGINPPLRTGRGDRRAYLARAKTKLLHYGNRMRKNRTDCGPGDQVTPRGTSPKANPPSDVNLHAAGRIPKSKTAQRR